MDDFMVYGDSFEESLANLEKVIAHCETHYLSLSHKKFFMLMYEGVILGYHISAQGIKVDP